MLSNFSEITNSKPESSFELKRQRHIHFSLQRGRCFFCKQKMVKAPAAGLPPDNALTLEHLYSVRDLRRIIRNKKAASCFKCNKERNVLENRAYYEHYPRHYIDIDYFPRILINILKYNLTP